MATYYVQSGTMRKVVEAESTRRAAIWAVHNTMQQVLPIDDGADGSPQSKSQKSTQDGVAVLSGTVSVSPLGFDRVDASAYPTLEVVTEWNQLISTLDRLERNLYRAA